jgi:hypothetical protein
MSRFKKLNTMPQIRLTPAWNKFLATSVNRWTALSTKFNRNPQFLN